MPANEIAPEWAAERIPALDLRPTIRAAEQVGRLYYPSIAHWNEEGHILAAETIEQFVDSERLLDQGNSTSLIP